MENLTKAVFFVNKYEMQLNDKEEVPPFYKDHFEEEFNIPEKVDISSTLRYNEFNQRMKEKALKIKELYDKYKDDHRRSVDFQFSLASASKWRDRFRYELTYKIRYHYKETPDEAPKEEYDS